VFRQTFLTTTEFGQPGYHMQASPALYPGQAIRARLLAPADNPGTVRVCLYVAFDRADGSLERHHSPAQDLAPGEAAVVTWTAPDGGGRPIVLVGLDVSPAQGGASDRGRLQVDWLTWGGPPRTTFGRPSPDSGDSWKRAWVNATDHYDDWGLWGGNVYRLSQDRGTGLILQGEQSWSDYVVSTVLYPHLADEVGLAANVRGVRRYVALTLRPDGMARLLLRHDDAETVLIEAPLPWRVDHRYSVSLTSCQDGRLEAAASDGDQTVRLEATVGPDQSRGAIGLLLRVGHAQYGAVTIFPIEAEPAASSHAP